MSISIAVHSALTLSKLNLSSEITALVDSLHLPEVSSQLQPESLESKKEERTNLNLKNNLINFIILRVKKRLKKRNEI